MKRLKLDPKNVYFQFNSLSVECIDDDVDVCTLEDHNDFLNKRISMFKLATYLIRKVTKTQKTYELKTIQFLGLFYVLSFIMLRYYGFGIQSIKADPLEIIYIAFSAFKAYSASTQFVMFISAGLYDYKRKKMLMAQCTGLISRVDHKYMLFKDNERPELNLKDPLTILSWYYLRRSFLDFGKRYTLRIFMYSSLIFPVCIAVIIVLFLQLFGIVGVSYNFYLIPCFMLTIEVFAIILAMSRSALSLNNTFSIHRDLLLENFINAKHKINNDIDVVRNISFVIERLKHDEIIRPVTIIGITINESFMLKIFIVALSGLFAIIELGVKKG